MSRPLSAEDTQLLAELLTQRDADRKRAREGMRKYRQKLREKRMEPVALKDIETIPIPEPTDPRVILGMQEFDGRLFVATNLGVYWLDTTNGVLRPLRFQDGPSL